MKHSPRFRLLGFLISASLHIALIGAVVWLLRSDESGGAGGGDRGDALVGVSLAMFQGPAAESPADTPEPTPPQEPATEPTTEPEPVAESKPTAESVPETEPAPFPEPAAAPKPVPKPKPKPRPRPKPKPKPKPAAMSTANPATQPSAAPQAPEAVPVATAPGPEPGAKSGTPGAPGEGTAAAAAGGSGAAAGGFDGVAAWKQEFLKGLQIEIARHQFYPEEALRRRETGVPVVAFVLQRDGAITDVHLRRSSGSALIDEAAMDTLRRLGRYRPIPQEFGRKRWEMSVPIIYEIK